jgi:ribonuclease VapC
MVIGTSALFAIFMGEPERKRFLGLITGAQTRLISAANALETGIVLEAKRGEAAGREFDLFLQCAQIEVVAVDFEQVEMARLAWRRYGKGRHSAALNFGDCFAYALAKTSGEPLLTKGNDFEQTDLELCSKT